MIWVSIFGLFKRGALLGIVRFSSQWKDYKESAVKAGVYALRYAAQPADGDHTGKSLYRDFLLLVPAGQDQEPDGEYTQQQLVAMSQGASISTHPVVMGMFPVWEEPESETVLNNELDQPTLVVKSAGSYLRTRAGRTWGALRRSTFRVDAPSRTQNPEPIPPKSQRPLLKIVCE